MTYPFVQVAECADSRLWRLGVEEVGSGIMDAVVAIESRGSRGGLRLNVESFRFGLKA